MIDLLDRLVALRNRIHAVNRNPVPNRCRLEWREELDSIIADLEAAEGTKKLTEQK